MPVKVLITTNIRSLGELMRQALRETGRYRAQLADGSEQTLERARGEQFAVAIIDFGAVPDPRGLIAELQDISPKIKVVVMPASADEQPAEEDQAFIDAWLSMPFYLPNLIETLAEIVGDVDVGAVDVEPERLPFPSAVPKKRKSPQPAPEWLQDVNRVAQHLTRLSLESTAQAALITRGSQLWAYAGQLPQLAAEELARAVGHYWAHDGGSDLARFVRLEATKSEFMMYATSLGGDYVLALAFEAEMPFTEMRTHAGDLARKLSTPPVDDSAPLQVDSVPQQDTVSEEIIPASEPQIAEYVEDEIPAIPTDWRPDQDVAEGRQAFLEDMLASMEIPQPDTVEVEEAGLADQADQADQVDQADQADQVDQDSPVGGSIDSSVPLPPLEVDTDALLLVEEEQQAFFDDLLTSLEIPQPDTVDVEEAELADQADQDNLVESSIDSSVPPPPLEVASEAPLPPLEDLEAALDLSLADTQPTQVEELEILEEEQPLGEEQPPVEEEIPEVILKPGALEADTTTLHNLTYACVLVPRLPHHHLVGDLATFLTQWVTQLSLSFGWRLEHLAIRPDYLHWISVVPPNSSPGMMVHNIQKETSQYIFSEFPRLQRDNPSGEFWASGYLIVNGRDPFSRQMVREFIGSVRTLQGAQ